MARLVFWEPLWPGYDRAAREAKRASGAHPADGLLPMEGAPASYQRLDQEAPRMEDWAPLPWAAEAATFREGLVAPRDYYDGPAADESNELLRGSCAGCAHSDPFADFFRAGAPADPHCRQCRRNKR